MIYNVIIIGSGPAALTAALYCARAELNPVIFAGREDRGGLLMKTSYVENYPGFSEPIMGYDLINNMEKQLNHYEYMVYDTKVVKCERKDNYFIVLDDLGDIYESYTIIVATGSTPNKLGLPNEDRLWGKGISSCAVCDGALYKRKSIVVVGGGDSAMEEALFLTKFSEVILIHRRDVFRASKIMQKRLLDNLKIRIVYNTIIINLIGTEKLERIRCKNIKTNEMFDLDVDGLFYGLGLKPNSKFIQNLVTTDPDGYITKTPPGIFVAGDVADKYYKQAIVAAGDGCKAAIDVERYIHDTKTSF
jgi:thioredoxin reductase (NADPH)